MNHTHPTNAICYVNVVDTTHLWGDVPPLLIPLPKLVMQLALAIAINHTLLLILQRLHQPRIVSDIITSLVLNPSTLRHIHRELESSIWPTNSITILETMANLGLLYAMFIKGLHVDLTPITRRTLKTLGFATSIVILPFVIGYTSYFVFRNSIKEEHDMSNWEVVSIYWGTIAAVTSFPTVAPIVANLRLLCTDIGREVLSVGMTNDIFSWLLIFFTLAISTTPPTDGYHIDYRATGWIIFSMALFVLFCVFVIRPTISKIVGDVHEGENYNDLTVHMILFLVLVCGFISDFIGSHFLFGAFVLGMCIPNGVLASTLVDKMEDCVLGILMPLYYMVIGLRVDVIRLVQEVRFTWVILMVASAKTVSTFASSMFYDISTLDGFALGVLLSAKGLLPLVLLNIGHERGHLTEDSFLTLMLIVLVSTVLVGPMMTIGYRRMKIDSPYERRILEGANPMEELRIITCIHCPHNIPSIINLLEMSNITTQTPISIYVLHLIELMGRASAMLIEHEAHDATSWGTHATPFYNRIQSQSQQIITSFHDYEEQHNIGSFIHTLTIVSSIDTMHENIHSLAENKQATLIILPFHKQQGVDGILEDTNIEFRAVNQNVMAMAPCSIGLLVDRGLRIFSSSITPLTDSTKGISHENVHVAMVYIGGPDDREALTYAWRMAHHPLVTLTVIRFIVGNNGVDVQSMNYHGDDEFGIHNTLTENDTEKEIDEEFLWTFQQKVRNNESISYTEKVSNNGEEAIGLLRDIHCGYDLYIVGRGKSISSPLTEGLADWSDCPELGTMGDILVTSDFSSNTSVLVIQQYSGEVKHKTKEDKYNEKNVFLSSYP